MKKAKFKVSNEVTINPNLDVTELNNRDSHYLMFDHKRFSNKRQMYLFSPVKLKIRDKEYEIQVNFCSYPLCKWFGTEQFRVGQRRGRNRKKFKLDSSNGTVILCKEVPQEIVQSQGVVIGKKTI